MEIERIDPPGRPKSTAVCNMVKVGNTVYIAGQTGRGDDITAQAEHALTNLRETLASIGATPSNIVKWTVFLAHREDIPGWQAVRSRFFKSEELPAGALILVSGMARPEVRLEIESIAVIP